LTNINYFLGG